MIQAISDDLSPIDVLHAATAARWTTDPRPRRMVLSRCFGVDSIQACLVAPHVGGCEVEETGWLPPGERFLRHVSEGGLGVSVGTGTAYQYDLALAFSRALCQRFPQLAGRGGDLDRAIHELMANALVHGNLEVASPAAGLEGFDAYCKALDAALADPAKLGRHVDISAVGTADWVEVAIADQGHGFDPAATAGQAAPSRQHGLSIAASLGELSIEDGGRCVILRIRSGAP
ncbi:hypothetical protein [Magnetospirillum sp. SS-4]|uniref:hypothetical protein n=1 Tax=Magnetospirillum sp. SS-4 TaxID=2681465 RepID=UPI0015731E3E|nr:hypothetical protein [Magnetospirillum sp. SS-4]